MSSEEDANEQAYIEFLLSNIRCPVCHRRYQTDDILTLDHREDMWLMALSCPECETDGLVLAIVKSEETEIDQLTELTSDEIACFEMRGPITADEVLDFHEFMRDYHGDMAELLGDEPRPPRRSHRATGPDSV